MPRIIENYIKFTNSIPKNNEDLVDMTSLFEQSTFWTPIQLKFDNKPASLVNLGAVAIRNICQTYREEKKFLNDSVADLSKIVIGPENKDVNAQRMLLIHYSKTKIDSGQLRIMLMHTSNMRIKDIVDRDEAEWIKLGYKVVCHQQINDIIDEAMSQFGFPICKVAEPFVDIKIVHSSIPALRGFVGINQIFIHADNFGEKIKEFKGSQGLLQQVARMDIISLVTHELAHIRLMRTTNDLNSPTHLLPALANSPPCPKGDTEFGIQVLRILFGKHVDWFESANTLKRKGRSYINEFIESIEKQTPLPEGHVVFELVGREISLEAISGLDMEIKTEIC